MLVLSTDALAAALLAALVETQGYRPTFAEGGELPRDALRRVRPGVVLVDCTDGVCDAATIGPAKMLGARVVLFAGASTAERLHALARANSVGALVLPPAPGELRSALDGAPGRRDPRGG